MAIVLPERRGKLDIIASILGSVKQYGTNLRSHSRTSDKQFKKYMDVSIEAGFIRENGHGKELTERGERFLAAYVELVSPFEGYRKFKI